MVFQIALYTSRLSPLAVKTPSGVRMHLHLHALKAPDKFQQPYVCRSRLGLMWDQRRVVALTKFDSPLHYHLSQKRLRNFLTKRLNASSPLFNLDRPSQSSYTDAWLTTIFFQSRLVLHYHRD
jgi:hypothetical protein